MRTYVSPIGYNSTSVIRPVLSRGVDTGDTVVVIRPTVADDSRAEEAIGGVQQMLREIEPDVSLETVHIDHESFETAVLQCTDVIQAAAGERVVNLGGGARDVLLPFFCATIAHAPSIEAALFFSDIDGTVRELELPSLTAGVPDSTRGTLQAIAEAGDGISFPELTDATGRSKSTITRHVNRLADQDIVETWTEGKTKHVRVALTGELCLRSSG